MNTLSVYAALAEEPLERISTPDPRSMVDVEFRGPAMLSLTRMVAGEVTNRRVFDAVGEVPGSKARSSVWLRLEFTVEGFDA